MSFLFDLPYLEGEDHRRRLVAEVKFLTWTEDNLLRQVVYEGLREDKPARKGVAQGAAAEARYRWPRG